MTLSSAGRASPLPWRRGRCRTRRGGSRCACTPPPGARGAVAAASPGGRGAGGPEQGAGEAVVDGVLRRDDADVAAAGDEDLVTGKEPLDIVDPHPRLLAQPAAALREVRGHVPDDAAGAEVAVHHGGAADGT